MSLESQSDDAYRFEVSPRGTEWQWHLTNGSEILAYSTEPYATVNQTLGAVDGLWGAVSSRLYASETGFEVAEQTDGWNWRLVAGERGNGTTLAVGGGGHATSDAAEAELNQFETLAPMAPVRIEHPPEEQSSAGGFDVGRRSGPLQGLRSLLGRGKRHRRVLKEADIRIAVSGIRGKSSTTRRLDDLFNRRGYDTLTKITGDRPTLVRNGEIVPIQRHGPRVTLYENIEFFQRLTPDLYESPAPDVALVENQAITEYTMRMVNERFLDQDIVVLCNVRQDHTDTLGADRQRIARAFGRSIPKGAHVVSGEQHPVIHEYLREEIEKRGATITQVDISERHRKLISAETVYALNEVLRILDEPTLPDEQLEGYLASAQPSWSTVDGRRVFNAAKTNDIESTEAIRRALVDGDEPILPFVYLRGDRRSRSASFAEYLNTLADRGCIDRAHVGGDHRRAFADAVDVPCTRHAPDANATAVLDELVADGQPVIFMGNTVASFMREMERELAARAVPLPSEDDTALDGTDSETVVDGIHAALADAAADATADSGETATTDPADVTAALRTARTDGPRFELYEDRAGEYRWRFRDAAGTIRADSGEGYVRRSGVVRALTLVRERGDGLDVEVYEDNAGAYRWRARAGNGAIVADGTRGYDEREAADAAVQYVRSFAGEASVVDVDRVPEDAPERDTPVDGAPSSE